MQEGQNELNIVIMAMVSGDIRGGGDCRGGADGDTGTVRCQSINREHQIVSYF